MTNVFSFVGTHRDDPDYLLLLGDDGLFYACDVFDELPTVVDPDDDWVFVGGVEVEEVSPPPS